MGNPSLGLGMAGFRFGFPTARFFVTLDSSASIPSISFNSNLHFESEARRSTTATYLLIPLSMPKKHIFSAFV